MLRSAEAFRHSALRPGTFGHISSKNTYPRICFIEHILGFTHYCGKRRSDGTFIVWRKTAKKRMVAKLRAIKAELVRRKHDPSAQVGEWLTKVVQGYYQYHAVPGNLSQLSAFRHRLCRLWRALLNRRSQRGQRPWQRLSPLLERWIPFPRVLHPYPQVRFAAMHPR